ncbi:hypothetical protein QO010_004497 [Caulobacter ginsengisoli]|uniref:Tat pathway signal sequence domain protein n=1 Tax=Caulobacter ginsengisoli TaxID=400775 RepID=A0ABU0IXF7_9CAUL|nr:Tat pathway signal sequence domain protein [Caulobacter ginsengisoli]MDQ0466701.1 hypothetical protein [Caulobacter ginsengisoli]
MRRTLAFATAAILALTVLPTASVMAQGRPSDDDKQRQEAARKKKRDQEWNQPAAPLPALRNAGPCPYVKVLYDAGRYMQFKDNKEAAANVEYTGEIEGISSGCAYKDNEPIKMQIDLLFGLGRGPQGTDNKKVYRYWVAVTQRNKEVLAKEYFDLPVSFPAGADRTLVRESVSGIVIPRANLDTSGANFEILIGFDVTPEMAAFNRDGKRFRVNAGAPKPAGAAGGQ